MSETLSRAGASTGSRGVKADGARSGGGLSRIQGTGEMADLIRTKDWSGTPLGSLEGWSETLIATANLMLLSPFPFALFWGEEQRLLYNDAYRVFLGGKHPGGLGRRGAEVWAESWSVVGPTVEAAFEEGATTTAKEVLIPILVRAEGDAEDCGKLEDRWWTYSLFPVYDGGQIVGVANPATDDTPARVADRKRGKVAGQLEQILAATTDGVAVLDREWRFRYVNQRGRDMMQVSDEILGANAWEAFPAMVYEGSPYLYHYHRAMEEGIAGDFVTVYPEPLNLSVQVFARPVEDGMMVIFRDITAERKAHETLRASEESLRVAVEMTGIGHCRFEPSTRRLLACTSIFKANFGRGPEDAFDYDDLVSSIHADDAEAVLAAVQATAQGEGEYRAEYRVFWPDGTLHWIQARGLKLEFEDGRPLQIEAVNLDVTERRLSQAALIQTEKLAAVGRLAGSIAHEINNPLESVTNLLYLARSSAEMGEVQGYLETAERELRRVSAISHQTLRFYRQSSKPRPVACEELFSTVLSIYQGRLLNSNIEVLLRKRAERKVECFEGEIRQVLNNLVGNAIDALRPTGGRLLIRSRSGKSWRTGEDGIVLTVADTGAGMSAQVQKKIFEAFYTTKGIGGTGLGLWVSSDIVQRHGGTLRVRSSQAEGRSGTVFALFLPFVGTGR